jgi:hypothetical protein
LDAFFGADAGLAAEAPLAGLVDEILLTFPFDAVSFLAIFRLLPDMPVLKRQLKGAAARPLPVNNVYPFSLLVKRFCIGATPSFRRPNRG